ncbi:hypothetical protein [Burkholderia sp. Ac-20349]|uniref:hypothetical protein n=1 Tax=Burkholderia sp. Ac-20349 TaxID=2703893 RepID=UPI00197C6FE9|nr:hypothetical protein [Burkholderia sp. Ac-20349]MBN3838150.1 hypothetical protein [Burkholderia sp. Ac-20349]
MGTSQLGRRRIQHRRMRAAQFAHRTNHAPDLRARTRPVSRPWIHPAHKRWSRDERPRASPAAPATSSTNESTFIADYRNIETIKNENNHTQNSMKSHSNKKLSNLINDKLIRLASSKSNK